jgi:hypothetical protein
LRGRHCQRLLVHANRALDVQHVIRRWLGPLEWPPASAWRSIWILVRFCERAD